MSFLKWRGTETDGLIVLSFFSYLPKVGTLKVFR